MISQKDYKYYVSRFLKYFLQGILILAPFVITIYLLWSMVKIVDNIFPVSLEFKPGEKTRIYGFGFILVIVFVFLVGYISSFLLINSLWSYVEKLLEKAPGIKYIYGTTKDFFEAFAGDKKKFTKAVLANIDDNDVWRVGFITQTDMMEFNLPEHVAVYVPMAYSVAGNVYIIPRQRVKSLNNISATEAMKFSVSGGITYNN